MGDIYIQILIANMIIVWTLIQYGHQICESEWYITSGSVRLCPPIDTETRMHILLIYSPGGRVDGKQTKRNKKERKKERRDRNEPQYTLLVNRPVRFLDEFRK